MKALNTVNVNRGGTCVTINEVDFDQENDKLFVEKKAAAKKDTPKTIDNMNKEELVAVAAEKDVELDDSDTKAQIRVKIEAAEAAKAAE